MGLGPWGPGARSAVPAPPHRPPYLAVLHQAGHGLPLGISTCLAQPEGAEGRTAPLAQPSHPHPRLGREGAKSPGAVALSRECPTSGTLRMGRHGAGPGHSQSLGLPEVAQGKFLHGVVGVRGQGDAGHRRGRAGGQVVTVCLAPGVGGELRSTGDLAPPKCPLACPAALPKPPPQPSPREAGRVAAVSTPPEAGTVKSCLLSTFQVVLN